ncbi:hypothetical protein [Roseibium aggregatum]|uniref:Uncharacterized protein n=1 Tax=Roseibium aggregatum TaxID=187304 RepID=A0A939EE24_9HYPH|nr:hypothetical protein [Roseibium aggregatum]MBN9671044.1 hypothetical protein [Roseibium aggregatum]
MASKADIEWFKTTFWHRIAPALQGTVFDPDMLVAIASQETGYLWSPMRKKGLSADEIVRLCCGDTLDDDKGRKAFPKNFDELAAHPRGDEMFQVARRALLEMAEHVPGFGFAQNRPKKFCRGFGVFQLDLQFFKQDPDYFLNRKYETFENTLDRAVRELKSCLKKRNLENAESISDFEFCTLAITYNTGRFRPNKGLRQGHFDGTKYYGEHIRDYLAIARSFPDPGSGSAPPVEGKANITREYIPKATGPHMRVETLESNLRMRSEPEVSVPLSRNVFVELPDGWPVRAITGEVVNGFIEVEAALNDAIYRGFCSQKYLIKAGGPEDPPGPIEEPGLDLEIPAVYMPHAVGSVTKRTENAGAHSLNEAGMPTRTGTTPDELRADIDRIIGYLNPGDSRHKRYWPRSGLTFCNIYAHDFCLLSGVYLPRVWWSEKGLLAFAKGNTPVPRYGDTIREMRANDLFRWLRDFGPQSGWRRAISATELQDFANLGAVCIIIARRKVEGRSGHVSVVVPETNTHQAKRLPGGEVSSLLQSQAGSSNFNYSNGKSMWWTSPRFAEFAMWYSN